MALAASKVMQAKGRTETKIGGVDAMPPAIKAVQAGRDVCDGAQPLLPHPRRRDHRRRFGAVVNGAKTGTDIPKNIVTDGPVVTKANADGMLWMEDQFLI